MGVTETLCRYAAEMAYGDIPKEAAEIAKERILETVGISLAGAQWPYGAGKRVIDLVREMGGNPNSTVIGSNFKTSSPNAAFANGTSAMTLDLDDTIVEPTNHPSASFIPAVLALGEETKASGKMVLEAYAAGFEVGTRIGAGLGRKYAQLGYHQVALWPTLGIAMASAKLLGLNIGQMESALGICASSVGGIRRAFGTHTRPLHAGSAARNGIIAALLAKKGFTGNQYILDRDQSGRVTSNMFYSFPVVFAGEGNYDLEVMTEGLGGPLKLVTTALMTKWLPGSIPNNAFAELTLDMAKNHRIVPDQVEMVECWAYSSAQNSATYHNPQTSDEARWSIEYAVAVALLDGKVWIEQYDEERIHRADIREMIKKIRLYDFSAEMPAVRMSIRLKNGREYKDERDKTKGDPGIPLRRQDLLAKYRDCAQRVLSSAQVEESMDLIQNFEKLSDVGELMGILMPRP